MVNDEESRKKIEELLSKLDLGKSPFDIEYCEKIKSQKIEPRFKFRGELVSHYGEQFGLKVRLESAFNADGDPMSDMVGIYVKKEDLEKSQLKSFEEIMKWKKSKLELELEKEGWVLLHNNEWLKEPKFIEYPKLKLEDPKSINNFDISY